VKRSSKRRLNFIAAILWLLCTGVFAVVVSGCADAYYDAKRTPEARYNTYYAPFYYPYYPWYSYYGGAYYYSD
jgi:hypothetical protein